MRDILIRFWRWLRGEPFIKSLYHTFWHLLGTLLPLFIVYLLGKLFTYPDQVKHFIEEGEFCILGAAILTPATWVLTKHAFIGGKIRRGPAFVFGLAITLILCSATLFCSVYLNKMRSVHEIDNSLVRALSIVFLSIAIVIFIIAHYIEYRSEVRTESPRYLEAENIDRIDDNFDALP